MMLALAMQLPMYTLRRHPGYHGTCDELEKPHLRTSRELSVSLTTGALANQLGSRVAGASSLWWAQIWHLKVFLQRKLRQPYANFVISIPKAGEHVTCSDTLTIATLYEVCARRVGCLVCQPHAPTALVAAAMAHLLRGLPTHTRAGVLGGRHEPHGTVVLHPRHRRRRTGADHHGHGTACGRARGRAPRMTPTAPTPRAPVPLYCGDSNSASCGVMVQFPPFPWKDADVIVYASRGSHTNKVVLN